MCVFGCVLCIRPLSNLAGTVFCRAGVKGVENEAGGDSFRRREKGAGGDSFRRTKGVKVRMGRGVFGAISTKAKHNFPGEAAAWQSRLHRGLSLPTSRAQWGWREADVTSASAFPSRFRDLDEYEKQDVGLESALQVIGSILPVEETLWDRNSELHGIGGAHGVVQEAVHISVGRALMLWPRNQVRASS
jgi:hypothetical protein